MIEFKKITQDLIREYFKDFESDSDIVRGVSRVFPLFFFAVAALVCITTMTRMVDEQRTQAGVLKALGYSNGAILSQYFLYAGIASVLGCVLGIAAGSFPAEDDLARV